jgi:hypothetical protein
MRWAKSPVTAEVSRTYERVDEIDPIPGRRRHQIKPDLVERFPERRRADRKHLGDRIEGDVVVKDAEIPSLGDRPRHGQLPDGRWAVQEDESRTGARFDHARTS